MNGAKHKFGIEDKQMNTDQEKTCASCFFTTKFPGITIEENGSCNFCNSRGFAKMKSKQTTKDLDGLRRKAREIKDRSKGKYDCIIGASGGLDSPYVIIRGQKIARPEPAGGQV